MSEDVYAKAGIPMPQSDEPQEKFPDEVNEADVPTKSEGGIDWQKLEEDRVDREIRLEAIKLALQYQASSPSSYRSDSKSIARSADDFFDYLKTGKVEPKVHYEPFCAVCGWAGRASSTEDSIAVSTLHVKDKHIELYNPEIHGS